MANTYILDGVDEQTPAPPSQLTMFTGKHRQNGRGSRLSPFVVMLPGDTINNDDAPWPTYPGGKGGVYRKIIHLIPPHRVYIETHVGGGAIIRNKRPAKINIALDLDPNPINNLRSNLVINSEAPAQWGFINEDAISWLNEYTFSGDEFVYADPPYLMETRRQQRQLYRCEYTRQDHIDLLNLLKSLPCKVMISGYQSDLYTKILVGWHTISFNARTRGGSWATEYLWMNYPQPERLHDYSFLGDNYRERERITRKKQRWAAKWAKMPLLERQAILSALQEHEANI